MKREHEFMLYGFCGALLIVAVACEIWYWRRCKTRAIAIATDDKVSELPQRTRGPMIVPPLTPCV